MPNFLKVNREGVTLVIGYRRKNQQANIQRTGVGAGDFAAAGSVQFLGQTLKRDLLVYEGKVKEVFYHSDSELTAGKLVFTLGFYYDTGNIPYEDIDISQNMQEIADQIIQSFQLK